MITLLPEKSGYTGLESRGGADNFPGSYRIPLFPMLDSGVIVSRLQQLQTTTAQHREQLPVGRREKSTPKDALWLMTATDGIASPDLNLHHPGPHWVMPLGQQFSTCELWHLWELGSAWREELYQRVAAWGRLRASAQGTAHPLSFKASLSDPGAVGEHWLGGEGQGSVLL